MAKSRRRAGASLPASGVDHSPLIKSLSCGPSGASGRRMWQGGKVQEVWREADNHNEGMRRKGGKEVEVGVGG